MSRVRGAALERGERRPLRPVAPQEDDAQQSERQTDGGPEDLADQQPAGGLRPRSGISTGTHPLCRTPKKIS